MTAGQILGPPQSHGRMINIADSEPGLTKPGTTSRLTFDDYHAGLLGCDTILSVLVERYQHFGTTSYYQLRSSILRARVAGSSKTLML